MKTHKPHFAGHSRSSRTGFTLIELLVTISIIALVLGIAGPTTIRLFSTSSDTQAYNVFSTQMALARAGAIESADYVGLHCQITDSTYSGSNPNHPYVINNRLSDKCITAIVAWDEANNAFDLKTGEQPQEIPGNMAFGNVSSTFLTGSNYNLDTNVDATTATSLKRFTSLTVLFNPDGELVRVTENSNNPNIIFRDTSSLFAGSSSIWDRSLTGDNSGQQGASCVTMFNYLTLKSKGTEALMEAYLNESGQFIAANIYTGRLFPRE